MNGGALEARFRFYAELNDFLPPPRRGREFAIVCAPTATAKHLIEALGVPHTEVELILVGGTAARFVHRLCDGDRVSVYPGFRTLEIPESMRPGENAAHAAACPRFVADAHLGGLARWLRMAGFDTLYRNDYADREIACIAAQQGRIVLTRDRDLLKQRAVAYGGFVRSIDPLLQFGEVLRRFGIARLAQPFTRCLCCNGVLYPVAVDAVRERLPSSLLVRGLALSMCPDCRRIYWRGTHWQHMRQLLDKALGRAPQRDAEKTP